MPLFKRLNILNIFEVNKYLVGKLMYNIYNENALDIFKPMFTLHYNVHSYNTRQASHFHIPIVKKELRKSSISDLGAVTWNDIVSNGVTFLESEALFNKDLSRKILNVIL